MSFQFVLSVCQLIAACFGHQTDAVIDAVSCDKINSVHIFAFYIHNAVFDAPIFNGNAAGRIVIAFEQKAAEAAGDVQVTDADGEVGRFCGGCGAPLAEGQKFCGACGKPADDVK